MNLSEIETLVEKNEIDQLVIEFTPYIVSFSRRFALINYDYEDIMQECYIALISCISKYQLDKKSFVSFGISSIKNHIYNLLREQRRSYKDMEIKYLEDKLKFILSDNKTSEDQVIELESKMILQNAMLKLTVKELLLIDYIYYQNKTLSQYARINMIPYSLARSKKRTILEKIRNELIYYEN